MVVMRLGQAEEWQRQLDTEEVKHRAAISRREGVSRARVTQILNLLMDHSRMVGRLKDAGHKVVDELDEDPVPVRVRRRGE